MTAFGGVVPAGTLSGEVTELVGLVQRPPFAHEALAPVTVEVLVARVLVPVVNWVEVTSGSSRRCPSSRCR